MTEVQSHIISMLYGNIKIPSLKLEIINEDERMIGLKILNISNKKEIYLIWVDKRGFGFFEEDIPTTDEGPKKFLLGKEAIDTATKRLS